ncbi:MAG: outer spore coat protein CotE [Bacilli bacterium]|nr:outer spore coat protein CotE [Bacilli bacterium]
MLREILTRAVVSKGKLKSTNVEKIELKKEANKVIGCWVINSNFLNIVENSKVYLEGSFDVHVWYAINQDKDTLIEKKTITYKEEVEFVEKFNTDEAEYKVYCLEYPHCVELNLEENQAVIKVDKEYSIDAIGETTLMVDVNESFNEIKIDTDFIK